LGFHETLNALENVSDEQVLFHKGALDTKKPNFETKSKERRVKKKMRKSKKR
jgi:hypothetical protein